MSSEITMHVVVREGGKFDVTYDMTLHAVVKGGGSYDVPCEMSMHVVVGKGGKLMCLTTHVVVRRGREI